MPAKVNRYWEERVLSLKTNNLDWGAGRITNALHKEEPPEDEPVGDPPSERWIGGVLRNVWAKMDDERLREYREVHWPDTFQRGDLPWEASTAALELLALSDAKGIPRPPVSIARWYWRVTQTMPDRPLGERVAIAVTVATHQESGRPLPEGLEWWLAYAPWRQENQDGYERAVTRDKAPLPRYRLVMKVVDGSSWLWGARYGFSQVGIGQG